MNVTGTLLLGKILANVWSTVSKYKIIVLWSTYTHQLVKL